MTNQLSRMKLHQLIDSIDEEHVKDFSDICFNLFEGIGPNGKVSKKVLLRNSLTSVFDIRRKEKAELKSKLRTSLLYTMDQKKKQKKLHDRVKCAKLSCEKYELKVKALSERLVEWIKFNRRSSEIMRRLRERYEEERDKRKEIAEELRKVKIYAEIEVEDDKDEKSVEKKNDEELTAPAPPAPPIQFFEQSMNDEIKIVIEDPDAGSTAPPPPPPPFFGGGGAPGAPPPPPGLMMIPGFGSPTSPLPSLPEKSTKTVNIRLGRIPKRRLGRTVFKQDRLLEKGREKFWNNSVKFLLEEKFQFRDKESLKKKVENEDDIKKDNSVPLVDSQKTLNGAIVCSKITNKEEILRNLELSEEWCYSTPEGLETLSRVQQLLALFSPEEGGGIISKGLKFSKEEIKEKYSEGDEFIVDLFRLNCLEVKLFIFEFLDSYKSVIFEQIKPELELYINFCDDIKNSEKFRNFLSLVLVITNFLNKDEIDGSNPTDDIFETGFSENKNKKKSKSKPVLGISVRSLHNLARVKNPSNKNENLMDVVYNIVLTNHSDILEFEETFCVVHDIVDQSPVEEKMDSFKKFRGCVAKLENVRLVHLKKEKCEGRLHPDDKIVETLEDLLPSLKEEVKIIEEMFESANQKISEISDYYGHPKESIHEFFIDLRDFMNLLDQTKLKHSNTLKKLLREEKRKARMIQRIEKKKKKEEERTKKREEKNKKKIYKKISPIKIEDDNHDEVSAIDKIVQKSVKKQISFNAKNKWRLLASRTKEHIRSSRSESAERRRKRSKAGLKKWKVIMDAVVTTGKKHGANSPEPYNINQQWEFLKGMSNLST